MKGVCAAIAGAIALATLAAPAAAGEFELEGSEYVQNNWAPNDFRVFCGTYAGVTRNLLGIQAIDIDEERDNGPCFPETLRALIRTRGSTSMAGIREMGFRPPPVLGPVMDRDEAERRHVRIYEALEESIASTNNPCNGEGMAFITLKQGMLEFQHRRHLINYFLAHELFHTVQQGYPAWSNSGRGRPCGIAGWISESTADAISTELTRRAFPRLFPVHGTQREIAKFAGMRRYDVPLNVQRERRTGERIHYLTSSFWRHLAQTYHGNEYGYIHRYFRVRPDGNDWLGWLNNRLQADPGIQAHLSIVYPIFLADYANWGREGRPGEAMGQEAWLARTFNGCHTIRLSPDSPSDSLPVGLRRLAGECIRVTVSGVGPDDRSSVKVAAVAGNAPGGPAEALYSDQLHLSLAATTDRTRFNCSRWIRRHGRRGGFLCLFVPDTGAIRMADGTEQQARVWRVRANEAAVGGTQGISRGAGFTNTYVLARVAVEPHEEPSDEDGGELLNATVYFVLDVSRITASPTGDRTAGDTGSETRGRSGTLRPNRQRAGGETRVVGTLNTEDPALAQEALPTYNPDGSRAITHTNPAWLRPQLNLPAIDGLMRQQANLPEDALFMFKIGHVRVERSNPYEDNLNQVDHYLAYPLQMGDDGLEPRPIRIGETGTFLAALFGGANRQMFGTLPDAPARLEILTHTREVIRLRISGQLCRILPPRPGKGCHDGGPFEAEMVKAFPAAYTPSGRFTIYDTPGTAIYRSGKGGSRPGPGEEEERSNGDGGNGGSGDGGSSATLDEECDCTCEGFESLQERARALRNPEGGEPDMSAATQIAQCMNQCLPQFIECRR